MARNGKVGVYCFFRKNSTSLMLFGLAMTKCRPFTPRTSALRLRSAKMNSCISFALYAFCRGVRLVRFFVAAFALYAFVAAFALYVFVAAFALYAFCRGVRLNCIYFGGRRMMGVTWKSCTSILYLSFPLTRSAFIL